jgi:hypothetical protein
MDSPAIELSEKPFNHTTAVELRDRSNIEDSNLNWISGDLFVSPSPPGAYIRRWKGLRRLDEEL